MNDYPKYNSSAWVDRPITNEDGVFRVVAVPGPVLLIGGPDQERLADKPAGHLKYKPATPDPDYPQYFSKKDQPTGYLYYSYGSGSRPLQGNFCKVLQIKPGVAVVKQDVLLETGSILPVRIRDAEGQPLAKTWVSGMSPEGWEWPIACPADSCAAYNLEPGQHRLMVFFEPTKKLMGSRTLKGGDKQPVVVKLAPAGAIKGQLLDADGKPLVGVGIAVSYRDPEAEAMERIIHEDMQVVTDARGAFTIDELIPGLKFELAFYHSKRGFLREAKPAQAMNPLQAGESRDVGAIKLK